MLSPARWFPRLRLESIQQSFEYCKLKAHWSIEFISSISIDASWLLQLDSTPTTTFTTIDEREIFFSCSSFETFVSLRRPVYVLKTMNLFLVEPPTDCGGKGELYKFLSRAAFPSVEFGNSVGKVLISLLISVPRCFLSFSVLSQNKWCRKSLADFIQYCFSGISVSRVSRTVLAREAQETRCVRSPFFSFRLLNKFCFL